MNEMCIIWVIYNVYIKVYVAVYKGKIKKNRNLPCEHSERILFRDRDHGATIPY